MTGDALSVVQVTPRYPPQTGGVENHVREISERLVDRGHEVTVLTADAGRDGEHRETRNGVAVRRHRSLAPSGAYHVAPGIAAAVRKRTVDVVHAHNYHSLPLAFAAAGVGDGRFVATPHYHGESASGFRNLLHRLYHPFGARALRRADAVVSVSEWEGDRLAADFGVESVVVPNGIDVERFQGAPPADRANPYVLTVGRLEAYKGVQHVVRALQDLQVDLVVAGSGPYRDELEAVAEATGVADRVTFEGYVPDDELPGLYARATAYVTMSAFESFGLTVGEALAAGTPCVVRDEGALAEWGRRPDCVAVGPDQVAAGVRRVRGRDAPQEPLPTWEDAVDELERLYASG